MFKFRTLKDEDGNITQIETDLLGYNLLNMPKLNKGCAFTPDERLAFGIDGLLPQVVETLDQQAERTYQQFQEHKTNLGKNIYLNMLHDYNETLFFKLISNHLEEMIPIIYTPTVGEAVQRFSLEHRKTRGLYFSYPDRDNMEKIIENRLPPEVDLSVVTDGEAVLGIGDQGIGGINIPVAKLMVYTLCAGINPHRTLPIQLDVGTNNPHLLNDPLYLGWRHERISGNAYDDFIDQFVQMMRKKFPNIMLHFEDFGRNNARRILSRYRNDMCTINGDMQSTGIVALACVLAGVAASSNPLQNHRVVILGAGTAGVGIADQIRDAMIRDGMSEAEAHSRIYLVDRYGLLTEDSELQPFQKDYARKKEEIAKWELKNKNEILLYDVVHNAKPTILVGCSTAAGAFSEEVVKKMHTHAKRPIILPLSNPNALAEAHPKDLYEWTKGKAIVATGSPFPEVEFEGKRIRIAQSNNAFAFPGLGLGAIAVKAKVVTDNMLWAATQALASCSPTTQDKMAPLLPPLSGAKMASIRVAEAVAEQAREEGLAQVPDHIDVKTLIEQTLWEPRYYPYKKV